MTSANIGLTAFPTNANRTACNGVSLPFMRCPSSLLPEVVAVSSARIQQPSYVGNGGSTIEPDFLETRVNNFCLANCAIPATAKNGVISSGGVLIPNDVIRFGQITDGTSNTIAVAESSDWANDVALPLLKDISGGGGSGFFTGTLGVGTPPFFINGANNVAVWNLSTLKYPPGTNDYTKPGIHNNHSVNNPWISAHAGGTHVVFVDGSVRMISNNVNMVTLRRLATRDDGQTIGEF